MSCCGVFEETTAPAATNTAILQRVLYRFHMEEGWYSSTLAAVWHVSCPKYQICHVIAGQYNEKKTNKRTDRQTTTTMTTACKTMTLKCHRTVATMRSMFTHKHVYTEENIQCYYRYCSDMLMKIKSHTTQIAYRWEQVCYNKFFLCVRMYLLLFGL